MRNDARGPVGLEEADHDPGSLAVLDEVAEHHPEVVGGREVLGRGGRGEEERERYQET
jgi:hypothetical protein